MVFELVALGLILLVLLALLFSMYNGLVYLENQIDKAWSNIDVLLQQRADEIPNVIALAKRYLQHEDELFTKLAKARSQLIQAQSVPDKAYGSEILTGALTRLFGVAENYPQLKSSETFMQAQRRLSSLESQIADRREFYNDAVNTYNTRVETLPDLPLARMMGLKRKDFFKVPDEKKVDLKLER